MTKRRPRRVAIAAVAMALVSACSSGPGAPTESPSGGPSPSGGSPSPSPTASPARTLATFEPDAEWRPILELIAGPLGTNEGSFDVGSRYRIRYDCVGDGNITIRVASRVRARRDCDDPELAEPELVRGLAGGRLRARVTHQGEVEWIVHFEVPR